MIQFHCPECDRTLRVADSNAGKLCLCPDCKSKIRIPKLSLEEEEESTADHGRGLKRADEEDRRPVARSRRPRDEDDSDDGFRRKSSASRPERKRTSFDDNGDLDDDDRPMPRRPRKKKRRRRSANSFAGLSAFWIGALAAGIVVLILAGLSVVSPVFASVLVVAGWIVSAVGGIWFLAVAFQDDTLPGLLCMLFPFYSVYYLLTHFDEEKWPAAVEAVGIVVMMIGFCMGGFSSAGFR